MKTQKKIPKMVRRCGVCGAIYSPNLTEGGRLPRGHKTCPRCHSKETAVAK